MIGGLIVLLCVAAGQKKALDGRMRPPGPQNHPLSRVTAARALGPEAFGDKNAVLFNMSGEAMFSYFLRNSAQLCPMRGLPFPESLPRLQKAIGADWTYRYYLYFPDDQEWLFTLLKTNCPGKLLSVPAPRPKGRVEMQPMAVLFDISSLHLPPDQRKPLDEATLARQKRNDFVPWDPPGFLERWVKLVTGG
jgi:hypothetical protein